MIAKRWPHYCALSMILGFACSAAPVGAGMTIVGDGEHISIEIDQAPLGQALNDIARRLGAELYVRGELGEVSEIALHGLPVDVALRRLVAPHGLLLRLAPGNRGGPRKIAEIRVYRQLPADQRSSPTPLPTDGHVTISADGEETTEADRVKQISGLIRDGTAIAAVELSAFAANDPSATVRRLAVTALARLDDDTALSGLEAAIADQDPGVRLQAARGLASLLGGNAINTLERMAADETDQSVLLAIDRLIDRL